MATIYVCEILLGYMYVKLEKKKKKKCNLLSGTAWAEEWTSSQFTFLLLIDTG